MTSKEIRNQELLETLKKSVSALSSIQRAKFFCDDELTRLTLESYEKKLSSICINLKDFCKCDNIL